MMNMSSVRRLMRLMRRRVRPHSHGSAVRASSASATYRQRQKDAAKRILTLSRRTKPALLLAFWAGALALGYVFGWKTLEPRWSQLAKDYAARDDL
jgi:hypothetical protein